MKFETYDFILCTVILLIVFLFIDDYRDNQKINKSVLEITKQIEELKQADTFQDSAKVHCLYCGTKITYTTALSNEQVIRLILDYLKLDVIEQPERCSLEKKPEALK